MKPNSIKHCVKQLQKAWPLIKKDFESKYPGWKIKITHTHRTPEEQFNLYKKGRKYNHTTKEWDLSDRNKKVTNRDGYRRLSDHNYYPAKAFDVAVKNPKNDYTWDNTLPQWKYMDKLAKKYGVLNGSNWKAFQDMPHFYVLT